MNSINTKIQEQKMSDLRKFFNIQNQGKIQAFCSQGRNGTQCILLNLTHF